MEQADEESRHSWRAARGGRASNGSSKVVGEDNGRCDESHK